MRKTHAVAGNFEVAQKTVGHVGQVGQQASMRVPAYHAPKTARGTGGTKQGFEPDLSHLSHQRPTNLKARKPAPILNVPPVPLVPRDLKVGLEKSSAKPAFPAVPKASGNPPESVPGRSLIYRRDVVLNMLGVSKSTLRRWMLDEGFPLPRQLGPRAVGWIAQEVDAWLAARPVTSMPMGNEGDGDA